MTKRPLIGIYGGTFDPIHFGHINLAIEMQEAHGFEQVLFCPAFINPHKREAKPLADPLHRFAMVKLALAALPSFQATDVELKRQDPSYMVDTLKALIDPAIADYGLILGEDALPGFFDWFQPLEIIRRVRLFVGSRRGVSLAFDGEGKDPDPRITQAILQGLTATRELEISSTDIRDRIARGLYCGHLVPAEVLDYIQAHHLYS